MIFDPKSLVEAPRAQTFEWLLKIARMSHQQRMQTIPVIEGEIQGILDYIADLKKAEENYLDKLGFRGEVYTTLPEYDSSVRNTAAMNLGTTDFVENTNSGNSSLVRVSQQDVQLGMISLLQKIRNEDRYLRRINYKILNARLQANLKMETLRKLKEDKTAIENKG